METTDLETNPEVSEAVLERQDPCIKETKVDTIRALEDRYGDGHLVVGRCRQLKKRPREMEGSCRSWLPPTGE
jgi:hypothetical protein